MLEFVPVLSPLRYESDQRPSAEELEQAQFFAHLTTTLRPLKM